MNIEIDKYMNMTAEEFNSFVLTLHVKQVKQLYEYLRKQLIANAYNTNMDGSEVAEHVKKKELKVIVKRIYDAMGHVPNKQESKIIRKQKQEKKKTR